MITRRSASPTKPTDDAARHVGSGHRFDPTPRDEVLDNDHSGANAKKPTTYSALKTER